ncbi:MAG: hypothetical protein ABFC84_12560 [Veillonellales bacterium]
MASSTVIATFYNFGETSLDKGRIRLLTSDSTSSPAYTPAPGSGTSIDNTDLIAFYFNGGNNSGLRVLVVEREYDSSYNQLPCYISVYNPSSWTATVARDNNYTYSGTSQKILNVYGILSPSGGTFYGTDYSTGRVFKMTHSISGSTESLSLASDYYPFAATEAGASVYSVALALIDSYLYAIAQQYTKSGSGTSPSDYTYYGSIIAKLNPASLGTAVATTDDAAPNAFDIQVYDGNLYVTALGGPQWYGDPDDPSTIKWNYESRIQKVTTSLVVTNLVRPADDTETGKTDDKFDIRSLAILSDGTAYILTGSYDQNYSMNGRFWKTTMAKINGLSDGLITDITIPVPRQVVPPISSASGYLWVALPADDLSRAWGMLGDNLGVYATSLSGSTIGAAAASGGGWTAGTPSFNAISLAEPATTFAKELTVRTLRGYVHPVMASGEGIPTEERKKFIQAHFEKK